MFAIKRVHSGQRAAILALIILSTAPMRLAATDREKSGNASFADPPRRGATFVVNSTGDDSDRTKGNGVCETDTGNGICTLRAAIEEANWNPDADIIQFNIPGPGPHVIVPINSVSGNAFNLRTNVLIDGFSQPGSSPNTNLVGQGLNTVLQIVINGTSSTWNGFSVYGEGAEVRGLVIQNFPGDGISLWGNNEVVAGCFVGTDVTGKVAQPNHNRAISIGGGVAISAGIRIGGLNPEDRNLISGNATSGISIGDSEGSIIQGNLIGTTINGTDPLGNYGHGVYIEGSSGNLIGGKDPGASNVIAFNGMSPFVGSGVIIRDHSGVAEGNQILGNSIFSNTALGIELCCGTMFSGPSLNDPLDVDGGANGTQNFPVIKSVPDPGPGLVTISGSLNSTPSTNFRLEFFSNRERDPSGFGEGEVFLGSTDVTTNGQGNADFSYALLVGIFQTAKNISATATDLSTGNTSEFSPGPRELIVNSTGDGADINQRDTVCNTGDTIDRGNTTEPECTLRAAMEEANAVVDADEITFDIPSGSDAYCLTDQVCHIFPNPALPVIEHPLLIDGYSQHASVPNSLGFGHGLNTILTIDINGQNAGGTSDGFRIISSDTWIRGVNIRQFGRSGVHVISPPGPFAMGGIKITGNFIGTTPHGISADANLMDGVFFEGIQDSFIGGPAPEDRNLISGNGNSENTSGIRLGSGASNNTIEGNLIGTDISGENIVSNRGNGLVLENPGTNENTIVNNVISGSEDFIAPGTFPCSMAGVRISDTSARNILRNNYIGLSASGTLRMGNGESGVCLADAGVNNRLISNTLSANVVNGVEIRNTATAPPGSKSEDTEVSGNFIGTDPTGKSSMSNFASGIFNLGAPGLLVKNNVISGNNSYGVEIDGGTNNLIIGNKIGTNADGTEAVPNANDGIIVLTSENIKIGSPNPGEGNLISGNGQNGILLLGPSQPVTIKGNLIGTDFTGGLRLPFSIPNGASGIEIISALDVQIGGLLPFEGNFISGNSGDGIRLFSPPLGAAVPTFIQGNYIGVDATGVIDNPNKGSGINIVNASEIEIEQNMIANNVVDGVRIGAPGTKNRITQNSMFDNQKLGIDLNADGLTANDALDADNGANKLMNTPVIGATGIDVAGNLITMFNVDATAANASYPLTVEFFLTDLAGDEGKMYLISAPYNVADIGKVIEVNLGNAAAIGVVAGHQILATATDLSGNTSEFSDFQIVNLLPGLGIAFDFGDAPETGPQQATVPYGYPTMLINDGARHIMLATIHLGDLIDDETDGLPTIQVAGDDLDGLDDDDGIVFHNPQESNPGYDSTSVLVVGRNELVALSSVSGFLNAWIDFNRDGDWDDVGEQIFVGQAVSSGPDRPSLSYQVPDSAKVGLTVARFRFSTDSLLAPTGMATNGEVEDYLVKITRGTNVAVEDAAEVPGRYALYPNYPNPFNPTTRISYAVRDHVPVHLSVYDALGRRVAVLVDSEQAPGRYEVTWDARSLPSGLYLARIRMGAFEASRTMLLLK